MSSGQESYDALFEHTFTRKTTPHAPPPAEEEKNERFYGFVPGVQDRAHNIEFRKGESSWPFLEYSYLVGGEMVHAGEFILRFATGERVTVRGRNLRSLYQLVLRHRVTWLRDADAEEKAKDGELFIDEIEGPVKEEQEGAAVP